MNFTKSQKIALIAVTVLLLVIVGYVFLYKHISALQIKLVEIKNELSIVDALELKKLETASLLEKTKEGRDEISSYFVSKEDPTRFLEFVEALGKESGISLEVKELSMDIPEEEVRSFQDNVKVVLYVEGGWSSLYHFLWLLERMPYVVTVANTALAVDNEGVLWGGQIEILCSAR